MKKKENEGTGLNRQARTRLVNERYSPGHVYGTTFVGRSPHLTSSTLFKKR